LNRSGVRNTDWPASSNTPDGVNPPQRFHITHPFHPLRGREFALVTYRHDWGEDRVYFHHDNEQLISVPTTWTSVSPPDPFVAVSAGRSPFRLLDLLELAGLVEGASGGTFG
jgi:hypothetical protein